MYLKRDSPISGASDDLPGLGRTTALLTEWRLENVTSFILLDWRWWPPPRRSRPPPESEAEENHDCRARR